MKKIIKYTMVASYFIGMFFLLCRITVMLTACNDELEVQQVYPFSVTTMPVQKKIKSGKRLKSVFSFTGTDISMKRNFPSGTSTGWKGETDYVGRHGIFYRTNDTRFRVKRSACITHPHLDQQTIDIYIEDNSRTGGAAFHSALIMIQGKTINITEYPHLNHWLSGQWFFVDMYNKTVRFF